MDKAKDVAKRGWHPKGKDGGKESWRGDFKPINRVATKLGHGKNTAASDAALNHNSRPLSFLKDPDSFGPPPKNVNYHGGAAVPDSITPDRRGLGAPLPSAEIQAKQGREQQVEVERSKPAPPPVPFRANRTGIQTADLPVPPVRRIETAESGSVSPSNVKPPKPKPPPRLPPRQNSHPLQSAPCDPPPPYSATSAIHRSESPAKNQNEFINRGAVGRLGAAGVSVPGLGIGRSPPQGDQSQQDNSTQAAAPASPPVINNLSSRIASLSTSMNSSNDASPPASSESGGTTFAQKQAALKTASNFRNDPSSVSLADAKASAATANNFRERHGDQVAQGWKMGAGLNQKYGIADRVGAAAGNTSNSPPVPATSTSPISAIAGGGLVGGGINRKPPPPPVPVGSKPR